MIFLIILLVIIPTSYCISYIGCNYLFKKNVNKELEFNN